jgi:hypothetical protein
MPVSVMMLCAICLKLNPAFLEKTMIQSGRSHWLEAFFLE